MQKTLLKYGVFYFLLLFLLLLVYLFSPKSPGIWFSILIWILFFAPLAMVFFYRKSIPRLFIVGNLALILFFTGIELGLRAGPLNYFFTPMDTGINFSPAEYFFWIRKDSEPGETPTSPLYDIGPGFEKIRFNFRTGVPEMEKGKGVKRAIIMGGSIAWGLGVEPEKTLLGWIEVLVNELYPHQKWEFINAGAHGFCMFQNLVLYKLLLRNFSPDVIIYFGNINENFHKGEGPYTYREIFEISAGVDISRLWMGNDHPTKKKEKDFFHSFLFEIQSNLNRFRIYNASVKGISLLRKTLFSDDGDGSIFKAVNSIGDYEKNLNDLIEITNNDKVKIIFADPFNYFEAKGNTPSPYRDVMKKVCEKSGLPFVPIHKVLSKENRFEDFVQVNDKHHLSEKGHKTAALLVFNKMKENNFFE